MNAKQARTFAKLQAVPTSATVAWSDLEGLLVACGCRVVEGAGSRVSFEFKGHVESFHRPHPAKEAKRYQVRQACDFLLRIGVKP